MGYHFRKQLIIIFVIVLFLAAIGALIYFLYFNNPATCSDGIQNQNEEGVDCGGPCISCERLTIRDITVEWVRPLPLKTDKYDLVAKIQNPNPNFGLAYISYSFLFYDSAGQQVAQQKGKSFILPNQNKYLIEGNIEVLQNFSRVDLKIDEPASADWQKFSSDYALPSIYVREKQFRFLEDQPGVSQASGIIKNDSPFDFDVISALIVLFDSNKQIIGANRAEVRTVLAGEERYFSSLWFTPLGGQVASIDMQAETNLLSDDNFMRQYGAPEKFQEYESTPSSNNYF